MGQPIATTKSGFICFAFPDVCLTAPGPVPVPYPNIGQLSDAQQVSDSSTGTGEVKVGGYHVILVGSSIQNTTGDQAGQTGATSGQPVGGPVDFEQGSQTVQIHGQGVVRMMDPTKQNHGNAVGVVLGGVPNVLVGG